MIFKGANSRNKVLLLVCKNEGRFGNETIVILELCSNSENGNESAKQCEPCSGTKPRLPTLIADHLYISTVFCNAEGMILHAGTSANVSHH